MANEEQLKRLLKSSKEENGCKTWNEWRKENPEVDINLQEAHLPGANLQGANLQRAQLLETNLQEARLHRADLRKARLQGGHLQKAILQEANLQGASLQEASFQQADLQGANLRRVYLQETLLHKAILRGAQLQQADLWGAHLHWADLREASLRGANLQRVYLEEANLQGADLWATDLQGAHLQGSDFYAAHSNNTVWGDLDLSLTKNLEEVDHSGPSLISTSTLQKSKGTIPVEFLKGCGLSDWEIELTKIYDPTISDRLGDLAEITNNIFQLRANSVIDYYSVFISHSSKDKVFARKLYDALQDKGVRCWFDEKQLLPGDELHDRITHGVKNWDKTIFCGSKSSLTSWWVDKELTAILDKEIEFWKKYGPGVRALIPLNLDGFMFTDDWQSGKKTDILSRVVCDFTNPKEFDQGVESVLKALQTNEAGREPPPPPKLEGELKKRIEDG